MEHLFNFEKLMNYTADKLYLQTHEEFENIFGNNWFSVQSTNYIIEGHRISNNHIELIYETRFMGNRYVVNIKDVYDQIDWIILQLRPRFRI